MLRPRSSISYVVVAVVIYILWNFSQPALLALSMVYMGSGIAIRIGGLIRRRFRRPPPNPQAEHQIG